MASTARQDWLRGLAWASLVGALILAAGLGRLYAGLPSPGAGSAGCSASPLAWPAAATGALCRADGSPFKQRAMEQPTPVVGPLAKRFRLAGTFFAVGGNQNSRKAIVDDLQMKEQRMVAEGDLLDASASVVAIFPDKIIARAGDRDEELRLIYADQSALPALSNQNARLTAGASKLLNRLGQRVSDNRWVLQRAELLKYYSELLTDTDRLARVFDSLKPVYKDNRIAGYSLKVEGEAELFSAVGLQQNDIVRMVNKMPMISQSRAEYFIREFVNNRANGFVLDIERNGKPDQLIYLVR